MSRAGALRTLVTFQQPSEAADGYGGSTVSWSAGSTVPCEYRAQSGREQLKAGRIEAPITATLRARARAVAGVDASWRAVIDGENWNIRQVIPFGQRDRWADIVIEKADTGVAV